MASLTLRDIRKSYGHLDILKGLTLDVADGEFVVLVGPSGCGKSTLLRMIAGLDRVSSGEIRIGDREVGDLRPKDRDIAMVFQNYALYPHMTVRKNMSFGLRKMKMPRDEVRRRVEEAAETLGLGPLLDRKPRDLSGGQRQRVAMGRAIVRHPQVFLFDEPLSNLDAQLRVLMRTEIRDLQQRLKVTSVYVTHDQVEAMTAADKIVVMNAGRIEQVGAPLELYDNPRNRFVAAFIGSPSMNFIEGALIASRDGPAFSTPAGLVLPVDPARSPASPRPDVTYGVRPEDIEIVAERGAGAKVRLIENMGHETLVHVNVGEIALSVLLRERAWFREGDTVLLRPRADKVHLFDGVEGDRLDLSEAPS